MFLKLEKEDYYKVKKLYSHMNYYLEIISTIEKKSGLIFVDDEKNPQTACIYNNQHNFYITGKATNKTFNENLSKYILNDICSSMVETDCLDFYIHFSDMDSWEEEIKNIFGQHYVSRINWRYYQFDTERSNIKVELPEGYLLKKIDAELLNRKDLKNIEKIIEWTSTEGWLNQEDFLNNGFGFCIITGQNIVSWCLADYVISNRCEIGIETDEDYRRKGFASIVVSACVKHCLSIGIDHIGWRCFESNIGSRKTAEKVGFKLLKNFAPFFGWFNSFDNYLVHAYDNYCNANYKQSSKLYEKAFELIEINSEKVNISRICNNNNKFWFYFNAARAYAHCNNIDLSISKLRQSFKTGLSKDMVLQDNTFKILNDITEFTELINKNR
ncbi:hypothetical protein SH1V18_31970 [Vallitalea longa]|uniref:N-acetyltransferase domain-containing protein n=1 Tax=Vallitalea longa TaxID=2936439 RepID=A0A9W5YC17_9FIRM|nr:GNAT family N-acetyltransferase [Vallitalea longa]GKX30717.1 hypothetical protein SH1V18_31970 [Vallitalea longa]